MRVDNFFVRAANASYKKEDRESLKKRGGEEKCDQQKLKQKLKKGVVTAVREYDGYVKSLSTIHKYGSETLNWDYFDSTPEPKLPLRQSDNQIVAESACRTYTPSLMDKLFGQCKQKHKDLLDKAQKAKQDDDLIYNSTLKEFKSDLIDWTKIQAISRGIKAKDPVSYEQAIEFFDPFYPVTALGVWLKCEIYSGYMVVDLNMSPNEIVPDFIPDQLASGKVVLKEMSQSDFYALFYSCVCSCALKIARETFALLPLEYLVLNVFEKQANTLPHVNKSKAILSVKFNSGQLGTLDFSSSDCTALLKNFPHRLNYSVPSGFGEVELISN